MIPIYKPYLTPDNTSYAHQAIKSGWVSSHGEYVERATELLKTRFGWKRVILTCNGTAAGHLTAIALKKCRPEVRQIVVPNNVYIAAWNSLLQERVAMYAIDANEETWQAGYTDSDIDDPETAILAVHNVGSIVNVPQLQGCGRGSSGDLVLIEDACEGLFGTYNGHHVGTASLCASISFFANKTLTSGEGGAFVTMHDDAYEAVRTVYNQGQIGGGRAPSERYVHDRLGYNYRMTNVQAALLYGQLVDAERIRALKKKVFNTYRAELGGAVGGRIVLQKDEPGTTNAEWMFGVRIVGTPGYADAERFFHACGIEIRPMFHPINHHAHLKGVRVTSTNVAELLHKECFLLPSWPGLSEADLDRVIEAVKIYAKLGVAP